MPNKTFLNLSKERQEEIIEICIEEFSTHDFDSASLNRIIEKLELAKGSFYRYFDNKIDLYKFLIDYVIEKKINYIKSFKEYEELYPGMEISKKIVYRLVEFDFTYYNYSNFILSAINSKHFSDHQIKKEKGPINIIKALQEEGKIRSDIDIDLIKFSLLNNLVLLRNFIIKKINIPVEELSKGSSAYKKYEKDINKIVEQYFDLLANGLAI